MIPSSFGAVKLLCHHSKDDSRKIRNEIKYPHIVQRERERNSEVKEKENEEEKRDDRIFLTDSVLLFLLKLKPYTTLILMLMMMILLIPKSTKGNSTKRLSKSYGRMS